MYYVTMNVLRRAGRGWWPRGGRGGLRIEKGEEERYDGDTRGRSVCAG